MDGLLSLQAPQQAERARGSTRDLPSVRMAHHPVGTLATPVSLPAVLGDSLSSGPPGHVKVNPGVPAPAGACLRPPTPAGAGPPLSCHQAHARPLQEEAPVGSPSLPGHVLGPLCGAHWPVCRGWPGLSYVRGSRCRGWTGWYPHSEPGTQPRQMDIPGRAHGQRDAVVPARGPICPSPQRERNRAASRRGSG